MTCSSLGCGRAPLPSTWHVAAARLTALFSAFCVTWLAGCGGSADAPPPYVASGPTAVAPTITLQPTDTTVTAPAQATFSAAASGTPAPTVQWQSSSNAGDSWAFVAGATDTTFTTPATVAADSGKIFRAVFSNSAGTVTSNSAKLTVTVPSGAGLSLLAGSIGGSGNLSGEGATARFNRPTGIAIDSAGNLYVADTGNNLIRKISPAGAVTTLAGTAGVAGGADGPGSAATFSSPTGIAVDSVGNVYVTDFIGLTVRKISPAGVVSTLAGTYSSHDMSPFDGPYGIAIDPSGNLFVTDQYYFDDDAQGTIYLVTPDGQVSDFLDLGDSQVAYGITAYGPNQFYFASALLGGDGYLIPYSSTVSNYQPGAAVVADIAGYNVGSADGTGPAASFDFANGLALDPTGKLFATDSCNGTIRQLVPSQVANQDDVTTVAGTAPVTTVAGTSRNCFFNFAPLNSKDGYRSAAVFDFPAGAVFDAVGNLYIVDSTSSIIRKMTPDGNVTTFAGTALQTGSTDGIGAAALFDFYFDFNIGGATATDVSGDTIVADTGNHTIRKIATDGQVTTFAGSQLVSGNDNGAGSAASFTSPTGLALDSAGNLYVADSGGEVIRKITPAGVVTTLAGLAYYNGAMDGTGPNARFFNPTSVVVDSAGDVFVTDTGNHTIRKITPDGVVSTFAGSTTGVGSADGTGSSATFVHPSGIAIDGAGNLYVADSDSNTIRKITPAAVVTTLAGTAAVTGSADGTGSAATFNGPQSLAVDATGNVYVGDLGNNTVRKITASGVVTTLIGTTSESGVRLGDDPRLFAPLGLSISGSNLVLISAGAVLRYPLP